MIGEDERVKDGAMDGRSPHAQFDSRAMPSNSSFHALATRDPALGFSYLAIAVISLTSILFVLI
ncbi:MAG: hypothetical protein WBA57_21020 [Elainellaceae cyanobacterium]